ncbi:MAG: BMP family ABC transporter substrate-binding protein [Rhodobacteraceae bacterium]|nr:BMP family ABC transporter substrate-binding protein [Paracoccaceae bacterium]
MRSKLLSFVALIFALSALSVTAQEIPKIAFIYISPADDPIGWTREHERGREAAAGYFGDAVQLDYFENVTEGADSLVKLRELAADGYDMVFTTSFGYMNPSINLAFENPGMKIEHATGYVRANNISTYNIRFYEGRVSQGIIAGQMTKTNKVGYIASFPIPEVIRGINSAFLAARSVNPDIEFEVVWLNSWYNPPAEEAAARQLVANGADILMQHTDTAEPMKVAEELGIFAFGQASDMADYGPEAQLSASVNNWGPYYIGRIQALLDGTWESADRWGGLFDNMLEIAPFSDRIPLRIQEQAADAISRIRAGKLHPFTGPIRKQDGSGWLAAGEIASDSDLLTMGFFVEGITGIIPR